MGFHCCAQVWSLVGELRSCKTRGAAPKKWGSWIVQCPTSFFSVSSWKLLFFSVFFLCMPYISLSLFSSPLALLFLLILFLIYLYPFLSSFYLFVSPPPTPPPPPPPSSCSLSLSHLLFELPLSITIPSRVGEQTSNGRKCAGCLTSLQLTVLWYLLKT